MNGKKVKQTDANISTHEMITNGNVFENLHESVFTIILTSNGYINIIENLNPGILSKFIKQKCFFYFICWSDVFEAST